MDYHRKHMTSLSPLIAWRQTLRTPAMHFYWRKLSSTGSCEKTLSSSSCSATIEHAMRPLHSFQILKSRLPTRHCCWRWLRKNEDGNLLRLGYSFHRDQCGRISNWISLTRPGFQFST